MSELPWSEVSVFVGPNSQSLRLVIDGYEMPQDLAIHFVQGTLTQEHVERIVRILAAYREQTYLYGPPPENSDHETRMSWFVLPPEMDAPSPTPALTPMVPNAKAREATRLYNEPEPLVIPKPEEVGLNLNRLNFYRQLYLQGVLNDDVVDDAPGDDTV